MMNEFIERMTLIDDDLGQIATRIVAAKEWKHLFDAQSSLDQTRVRLREAAWIVGQKKFTVEVLKRMRIVRKLDKNVIEKYRELL